ncbi:MAG: 2Fe-2S iron-sulfur cluster-binding protein [Saccharospirillum sp.]|uniref:2Fe-2S iron-sulfur cluster-binding protein n=1 Tax=Saccharospirillum sp. TaxID=2033801 RepID=UPI003297218F
MVDIVFVTNDRKTVSVAENSNLLRVSLREQCGLPFKCGGGNCGTCKCHIDKGLENTDPVKKKERNILSDEDIENGYRLGCQTFILGDVEVSWEVKK